MLHGRRRTARSSVRGALARDPSFLLRGLVLPVRGRVFLVRDPELLALGRAFLAPDPGDPAPYRWLVRPYPHPCLFDFGRRRIVERLERRQLRTRRAAPSSASR